MATYNKDEELKKNQAAESTNSLKGVDEATQNKISNPTFNASGTQQNAQTTANNAKDRVETVTSKNNIVSDSVWNTLNSSFTAPTAVQEADTWISSQLQKIQSGKTSYSDQVKDMMAQIQGREKFSYDVDSDPLFQQALASSMSSGKQAMQDTIGQASALTGGYGSTYATTAGNQAYNAFIEDAYDNLPQYYQMAMEAYQMEGDELYRQLGMLTDADDREYNRNITAYDATSQYRNRLYDESYQLFRDSKTDAYNMANLQLSEHGQLVSDAVNNYNVMSDYADTMYNREYQSWSDSINQAMQYAQMLNTDYWNQTNYDRGVYESDRAYDRGVYESDRAYDRGVYESDRSYNQAEKWNQNDLDYKYAALAQDQAQFDAKLEADATKDDTKEGYVTVKDESGNDVTYKKPTPTEKQKALDEYNKGGEAAYNKYIDSLGSDVYIEDIAAYVFGYEDEDGNKVDGYGTEPYLTRNYTKTKQTTNWFGIGIDADDEVQDNQGNTYTLKQLKENLKKEGVDDDVIDEMMKELNKKQVHAGYKYSNK